MANAVGICPKLAEKAIRPTDGTESATFAFG
jgi:hypothetical protein